MTTSLKSPPWLVRMHYKMRTAALGLLFIAAGLHMMEVGYALTTWAILGVLMLGYPHLQYWRTCHTKDPIKAELNNLLVDAVIIGVFIAAVEFSLWITFAALLGTLINNVTNRGWRGLAETILGFSIGIFIWIVISGYKLSLHTPWHVTLFCILGISGYLLVLSNSGFVRNNQLRKARERLQLREREILTANDTLLKNIQEISALQEQIQDQANRDSLTNLYNRRFLSSILEQEVASCKREGKPLAYIMIDVDHFKEFNDTLGHQAGDECLIRIAQALQKCAKRASDLVVRYGGEEFSIVLADTNTETAVRLAESARHIIESLNIPLAHPPKGKVTISAGVAVMPPESNMDADGLVRAADDALYLAKNNGRNQVKAHHALDLD